MSNEVLVKINTEDRHGDGLKIHFFTYNSPTLAVPIPSRMKTTTPPQDKTRQNDINSSTSLQGSEDSW